MAKTYSFPSLLLRLCGLLVILLLPSCVTSIDGWDGDARYATFKEDRPVEDEKVLQANLQLSVGQLEIEMGDPEDLYEMDLYYNEDALEPKVNFSRQGEVARFDFEFSGEGKSARRIGKTRASFRFSPQTVLRLDARTGVSESRIDLSGLKVESVEIESGVGETNLTMLTPNEVPCELVSISNGVGALQATGLGNLAFRRLRFRGGVGAAVLDLSGSWPNPGEVEIEVGVGGVQVRLPRNLGAEVKVSKSFLSGVDLSGFRKEGDTYYSDNMDRADKVVRIRIRAGIGGVEVDWI